MTICRDINLPSYFNVQMREVSGREDTGTLIGMTEEITSGNATGAAMTGQHQRSPRERPTLIQRRRILDFARKVTLMKKRMTTTRDVVAKAVWNSRCYMQLFWCPVAAEESTASSSIRISPCCACTVPPFRASLEPQN
ncbi:Nuclear cap-binding protein subunit 2 [Zea mays]|uniref:Nuclear cap-binding protein subunit 2 n=1 Tax=Zea mays TaxID=4577 RepID=A0A1D6HCY0_MAIZE|nr:Nuclear cap-binding protein subunit 2 [Zea mays]